MISELEQVNELARRIFAECDAQIAERQVEFGKEHLQASRFNNRRMKESERQPRSSKVPKYLWRHKPRPGEIWQKEFVATEARRLGIHPSTIYDRLIHGKYPGVEIRKVNERTVFVRVKALPPAPAAAGGPQAGEVLLKEWLAAESDRVHAPMHTVYMRLKRGKYPQVQTRTERRGVVYVSDCNHHVSAPGTGALL